MWLEFSRHSNDNAGSSSAMCRRSNEAVFRGGFSLSNFDFGNIPDIPFAIWVACAVAPPSKPSKAECIAPEPQISPDNSLAQTIGKFAFLFGAGSPTPATKQIVWLQISSQFFCFKDPIPTMNYAWAFSRLAPNLHPVIPKSWLPHSRRALCCRLTSCHSVRREFKLFSDEVRSGFFLFCSSQIVLIFWWAVQESNLRHPD